MQMENSLLHLPAEIFLVLIRFLRKIRENPKSEKIPEISSELLFGETSRFPAETNIILI
jgi:hypothetical protein